MSKNRNPEAQVLKSSEEIKTDIRNALQALEVSLSMAEYPSQIFEDTLSTYRAEDRRVLKELITRAEFLDDTLVVLTVGDQDTQVFKYGISDYDLNKHAVDTLSSGAEIRLNWTDTRIVPEGMSCTDPGYEIREMFAGYKAPVKNQPQAIPFAGIARTIQQGGTLQLRTLEK